MSASQSNLSSTPVDFVVATSFASINEAMFELLATTKFPALHLCWNQNAPGETVYKVSLDDVMSPYTSGCTENCGTNGTDPFQVPSWSTGEPETTDIANLQNSSFYCGMKIRLGIPPGMNIPGHNDPHKLLPYIVEINDPEQATLTFSLLCSTFQVVAAEYGQGGSYAFTNVEQPHGQAWIIKTVVPLSALNGAFAPSNVQAALSSLDPTFSIQQIFADLDNPSSPIPVSFIGDLPDDIQQYVTAQLIDNYYQFATLHNLPVLGYSISTSSPTTIPSCPFAIGGLQLSINEYLGSNSMLSTIQYLCTLPAVPALPPAYTGITWNWIDEDGSATPDGVVAVSKTTLLNFILASLNEQITSFCCQPYAAIYPEESGTMYYYSFTDGCTPEIDTNPPVGYLPGLVCDVSWEPSSYYAEDDDSAHSLRVACSYHMFIQFVGNQIIITQDNWAYFDFWDFGHHQVAGSLFSTIITDTYTLEVGVGGVLVATLTTETLTNQPVSSTLTDANEILTPSQAAAAPYYNGTLVYLEDISPTNLSSDAFSSFQNFVFPGGQTFSFTNAVFSENLDLVCNIAYLAP